MRASVFFCVVGAPKSGTKSFKFFCLLKEEWVLVRDIWYNMCINELKMNMNQSHIVVYQPNETIRGMVV